MVVGAARVILGCVRYFFVLKYLAEDCFVFAR